MHRYLYIAHEINAQGWKRGLGLEGVGRGGRGGGEYILKIAIAKGGTIFICNYLGEGLKFLKHHTFLNPSPGRNKRSVPYDQNI